MGYPSTGIESLYRNSVTDVLNFFQTYHNNNVKIFNLCLEKDRIYDKDLFPSNKVGLFPSKDHNPCPIKLILEFCVDISLYLMNNPDAIAAIHCKAGKGRTGVMICSYLIFSGLCENSEKALEHYGNIRSLNGKVIEII
jgi:phosphatidylinositol-3,4,5-trisphosphate 3-phosphatase/dual-specificity protein phosphatase PTEN